MELIDEVAEELRTYRHSPMASCDLAAHILAIPAIHDAIGTHESVRKAVEAGGGIVYGRDEESA